MLMKDVSFWCVILVIFVIFVVHHILTTFNVIEGLDVPVKDHTATYHKVTDHSVTAFFVRGIAAAEAATAEAATAEADEAEVAEAAEAEVAEAVAATEAEKVAVEVGDGGGDGEMSNRKSVSAAKRFPVQGRRADSVVPQLNTTTTTTTTTTPSGVQAEVQGIYNYYPGILRYEGEIASTLGCKDGTEKLTIDQAKEYCKATGDCNAFFHYGPNEDIDRARACFKKDVNILNDQVPMSDDLKEDHPEGGYYFLSGEKPKIDPKKCEHLKRDDKIYNLDTLNQCLKHLNGYEKLKFNDNKESETPVVAYELDQMSLDNWEGPGKRITPNCHSMISFGDKKKGIQLYNELCEIFGHKSVDVKHLRDSPDTNAKSNPDTGGGGYWPNRSTCKIFDKKGNFINNVSKTNGSGNKQVSEIKCSETPANSAPPLLKWDWYDRRFGFEGQTNKDGPNGCQNNKTKAQAQQTCKADANCQGFFAYKKDGAGRVCYKGNIDTNKGWFSQPGLGTTSPIDSGFWHKNKQ